jgi:pyruvate dehydrogenase E1 component alpha subunit
MDRAEIEPLYRTMLLIRRAEERLQKLFADGEVPGFLHLSIGQEAIPAGVSAALGAGDTVSSTHRGHGHTLAKGVALEGFFAEIMGKATGLCKGRGGSMHVADLSKGMLGANGIVGAGLPITTGSALALKLQGLGNVAVAYFGDGALAEGVVHECLNLAALWSLPVLFVCENNGWSEFTPTERQVAATLEKLAGAHGILYEAVDGNDVVAVAEVAGRIVGGMRAKAAPAVLDCATVRVRGHFEGDRQDYRPKDELANKGWMDPLARARAGLEAAGADGGWFEAVEDETTAAIEAAVAAARAAPAPAPSALLADVYTPLPG